MNKSFKNCIKIFSTLFLVLLMVIAVSCPNNKVTDEDPSEPEEPDTPQESVVEPIVSISELSLVGEPKTELSGRITVTSKGATFKKDLSK